MLHGWLGSAPRPSAVCALIALAALLLSVLGGHPHGIDPAWIAALLCGIPILYTAVWELICTRKIHADLLAAAALIAAAAVGEPRAAGWIALIMQFGTMLEEQIILRAQRSVDALYTQERSVCIDAYAAPLVRSAQRTAQQLILLAPLLAGAIWWGTDDIDRAVTALVVFCPCAFIHATPMAVSAAIASLARRGILLRTGSALERLSRMENIVLTPEVLSPTGYMPADAQHLITQLRRMGMHPVLLAPADAKDAAHIAAQAGIRDVRTALPPQNDPFAVSSALVQRAADGRHPAHGDCLHISMGGTSRSTVDVVCPAEDLRHLPAMLGTARQMRQKIEQNTLFGCMLNFIALGLAACGYLSPLSGALWHNAAAIFIVLNAALLFTTEEREKKIAFSTSL